MCQARGLAKTSCPVDHYVVVSMESRQTMGSLGSACPGARVLWVEAADGALPISTARNTGAEHAIAEGADLLIFLDVDCIPSERLVERYCAAASTERGGRSLLCGPVGVLPPSPPGGYDFDNLAATAHVTTTRPVPGSEEIVDCQDYHVFWGLSFAVTTESWSRIGGFCPEFIGYGGEDCDFAETARQAGIGMQWVGGAWAYHQDHPKGNPPVEHLHEIVRNANVFHRRWGWWTMSGWLHAFETLGLASYDEDAKLWVTLS